MILIYLKKYCGYVGIGIIASVSLILFYLSFKSRKNKTLNNLEKNFLLGEITGSLKEKNNVATLELKALKEKDTQTKIKLDKIKKINNVNNRREKIDAMLKAIPVILLFVIVSCSAKQNEIIFPSYLPPKIEHKTLKLQPFVNDLEDSQEFGRIAFDSAIITLQDGSTILLKGGFAFDDSETLKFIHLANENEILKTQVKILYSSYSNLYDASIKVEKIWQEQLNECSSTTLLDEYQCELCYVAGVSSVLGVLYSVDAVIKE